MNFLIFETPIWVIILAVLVFSVIISFLVGKIINYIAPLGREDATGFHADRYIEPSDICDHDWHFDSKNIATCVRCGITMDK